MSNASDVPLSFWELFWNSPPAVVGTVAALFTFLTLWRNHNSDNVKNSIDFISSLNDKDTRTVTLNVHRLFAATDQQSAYYSFKQYLNLAKQSVSKLPVKKDVVTFINEWERCANGVYYRSYDSHFLYGVYAGIVIRSYFRLLPYLLDRQAEHPRNGIKFSRLALDWHIKKLSEKKQDNKINSHLKKALRHLENHHNLVYSKSVFKPLRLMVFNWYEDKDPDTELILYHDAMTAYMIETMAEEGLSKEYMLLAGWEQNKPMVM